MVNYERSPKRKLFNLWGVILSSIVAFVCNIVGLIIYGCYFYDSIKENIAILDTIVDEYKSSANLGSGYWYEMLLMLFMAGCLLNPTTILLLYMRKALLTTENRTETVVIVARVNDPTTVLY
ncbi:hypothetical protein PV327_011416 [Microctonus hyperodae]|uniref:Uncharacterized protein n=1 Tax=Microctonus hyperodae TaxID=165561 RepID=A0AA39FJ01_MICHY|nr:hypothetical protein PV327_011416 [Microctonus hyperodae]